MAGQRLGASDRDCAGLAPAPERSKGKTWKEFLKAHWSVLSAADFFEVEVLTVGGLQRHWVMVVMELQMTKRSDHSGSAAGFFVTCGG